MYQIRFFFGVANSDKWTWCAQSPQIWIFFACYWKESWNLLFYIRKWQNFQVRLLNLDHCDIFRVIGFYLFLWRLGLHSLDNCINVCVAKSWKVAQIADYILNTEKLLKVTKSQKLFSWSLNFERMNNNTVCYLSDLKIHQTKTISLMNIEHTNYSNGRQGFWSISLKIW